MKKNRIVLMGGGGHCKSVVNSIYRAGFYNEAVVIDKAYPHVTDVLGISYPIYC